MYTRSFGGVYFIPIFTFLCSVICFVCLHFVFCVQCCPCYLLLMTMYYTDMTFDDYLLYRHDFWWLFTIQTWLLNTITKGQSNIGSNLSCDFWGQNIKNGRQTRQTLSYGKKTTLMSKINQFNPLKLKTLLIRHII